MVDVKLNRITHVQQGCGWGSEVKKTPGRVWGRLRENFLILHIAKDCQVKSQREGGYTGAATREHYPQAALQHLTSGPAATVVQEWSFVMLTQAILVSHARDPSHLHFTPFKSLDH